MTARAATLNSTNVRNIMAFAWHRLSFAIASSFAPERAVQKAAQLFATPPRHAHPQREIELLSVGRGFVVESRGTRLAAWRYGGSERPAVVFSHGWGGRGAQFGAFVPALLDAGYQVILFDHEGHGLSEGRESSLVHFIDGLEAVVREIESQGVAVKALVGHSLGAAAISVFLNSTGRDTRAVLIAPPTSVERYSGIWARHFGVPEKIRRAMQEALEARLGRHWKDFELPQSIANAQAPALIVHDEGDREVPASSGLALARAWRGARFLATRGLGHRKILRDPSVVQDAIDFIANRVVFQRPPAPSERSAFLEPAPMV